MSGTRVISLTLALCAALATALFAQNFDLSVQNIMRGPELVGTSPRSLGGGGFFGGARFSWSPDSRYVYFRWQQPGVDTALVVYRVAARGGEPAGLFLCHCANLAKAEA